MPKMSMQVRQKAMRGHLLPWCLSVLLALAPTILQAQDSIGAALARIHAQRQAATQCARFPLVLEAYYARDGGGRLHRDSTTGKECWVGPRLPQPQAYIIDGRVFCPDSSPARWSSSPAAMDSIQPSQVRDIQAIQDSVALEGLHCPLRPLAAVRVVTTGVAGKRPKRWGLLN